MSKVNPPIYTPNIGFLKFKLFLPDGNKPTFA